MRAAIPPPTAGNRTLDNWVTPLAATRDMAADQKRTECGPGAPVVSGVVALLPGSLAQQAAAGRLIAGGMGGRRGRRERQYGICGNQDRAIEL